MTLSKPRRSLIDIPDLNLEDVLSFLDKARVLKSKSGTGLPTMEASCGKAVALLFFEPSTRTRTSFEMAAFRLGLRVLNLDSTSSSVKKGETIFDTALNINALQPHGMVIRHSGSGIPLQVSRLVKVPVINAGDGFHAHPTQALLDVFTIREKLGEIKNLNVLIVGDIAHSRVARSNILLLRMMGAKVKVCGPPTLIPPLASELGVEVTDRLDASLPQADVVMALRMQMERQSSFQVPSLKEYTTRFGITEERLELIKEHAVILHPGPVNRGVEIMSAVMRDPRCKIIEQVENGVLIRTVLLSEYLGVPLS